MKMTVAIIAKYPWEDIKDISAGESEMLFIFSDSRIGELIQPSNQFHPLHQYQTVKQEVLAPNLIACYASNHVYALKQAFKEKLGDLNTIGPHSRLATDQDVKKLGRLIRKQHNILKLGSFSDVLVGIWPKGSSSPHIYQLMAPAYEAQKLHGIVGVGDIRVLKRFKELLPAQLRSQRLTSDDVQFDPRVIESLRKQFGSWDAPTVWNQARDAVDVAFTGAVLQSKTQTVDIPVTSTLLDKNGVTNFHSAVLKPNNEIVHITKFEKPGYHGVYCKTDLHDGSTRSAEQLFD